MPFSSRRVAAVAAALVLALAVAPALAGSHDGTPPGRQPGNGKGPGGSAVTHEPPFEEVVAFATKTGTRGVVTWQASAAVSPVVTWVKVAGGAPQELVVGDAPDTAGVGIIDGLEVGTTYLVTVTDQLTGASSTPIELVARNAYTDFRRNATKRPRGDASWRRDVYTIDLLVQLDSQSLPAEVPHDLALADIGDAFNIVAERMYDALDGHARLGTVLVTDTQLAYAVNEPFGVEESTTGTNELNPCVADRNLADVLVETAPPFDSHTFSYAIEEPCASFYIGRLGWLVANPWVNDLDVGYTSTHEIMHYAFGAPDLYGTGDATGTGGGGCKNLEWDGSLMHNSGGWSGTRWELTEVDRDPTLTPCDGHETEPWTWDRIQSRYDRVPEATELLDVVNYRPRGNPDGGALDIRLLDRSPAGSTLSRHAIDDSNPEVTGDCGGRADTSRSSVSDPEGDATMVAVADTGQPPANEPALDIVGTDIAYVDDGDTSSTDGDHLEVVISVDDLTATPRGSTHVSHELRFTVDGVEHVASARRDLATGTDAFRVAGVPIEGAFDADAGTVTLLVPAVLTDGESPVYALPPGGLFVPSATWSRRVLGAAAPVADQAAGGCEIRVPGTATGPAVEPDATLAEGESYAWQAGPFFDVGEAAGPCDVQAPCQPVRLQLATPDGSALTVAVDIDDAMLSYQLVVSGPAGVVRESVESGDVSVVVPVPAAARYSVTVNPYWSVGGSYAAVATLADVALPTVPHPTPDVALSDDERWSATGTSPTTNIEESCRPPDAEGPDPECITYVVDVRPADGRGTLHLELSADNPAEDWDVYLYDLEGKEVAAIGLPATVAETGQADVAAGVYYLVVQPYIALEGSGFEVVATLR